jgi:O-antigen/teichoic acid export membrane protein
MAALSAQEGWQEARAFVAWAVRTTFISSLVAGAVVLAAALIPSAYSQALLLACLAIPLLSGLQLMRGIVQGRGYVVLAQLPLDVLRWVFTLVLLLVLLAAGKSVSPTTVMLIVLVALVASLIAAALAAWRSLPRSPQPARRVAGRWLRQSLPFLAVAVFGIFGTEVSTVLLGLIAGPREAGLYQPIARIAPLMLIANDAIEAALAPRIVHMWHADDKAALRRRLARAAAASSVATLCIAVGLLFASSRILGAFGPEFTRYQRLLLWIAAAQVLNAATGAAPLLLAMTNDMRRRIFAQGATLIVQAGLALILIPKMGAIGAGISLTAAILTWAVLHWWLALRATGIDTSVLGAIKWR